MLGARIQQARQWKGFTQEQLAEAAGLRQGHISRLEQGGLKDARGDTLVKLATALDVSTDFLLGLADEPRPTAPAPQPAKRVRKSALRKEVDHVYTTEIEDGLKHLAHLLTHVGTVKFGPAHIQAYARAVQKGFAHLRDVLKAYNMVETAADEGPGLPPASLP